jgi:hypothetical protein
MIRPKRTAYLATFSRKSEEKYSNFKIIIQASDVAASSGIFYLQKLRKNSLLLPGKNPFVAIPNLSSSAVALPASRGTQMRSPGVGNNPQPGSNKLQFLFFVPAYAEGCDISSTSAERGVVSRLKTLRIAAKDDAFW